jgi:hypothetical protein
LKQVFGLLDSRLGQPTLERACELPSKQPPQLPGGHAALLSKAGNVVVGGFGQRCNLASVNYGSRHTLSI